MTGSHDHPNPNRPRSREHDPGRPDERAPEPTELERVLNRVVDGEASPADLARFRELLAADPDAWAEYASLYEETRRLHAAVERAVARAAAVALPTPGTPGTPGTTGTPATPATPTTTVAEPTVRPRPARRSPVGNLVAWSGWAAAVALFALWPLRLPAPDPGVRGRVLAAEYAQHEVAREPLGLELSPLFIAHEPRPDGRFDVLILRRYVERVTLDEFRRDWIREEPDEPAPRVPNLRRRE